MAREARVGRSFRAYSSVGSKDGLVEAVIAQAVVPHLAPSSLDALRQAIEAHGDDFATWHAALLESRDSATAQAPELARLLLVELLRDDALRAHFAHAWIQAVWQPLNRLFERLQSERRLRRDLPAAALARMFLALNLGYLIGRHVLAPGARWNGKAEIGAIAALFSTGAQAA